MTQSRKASARSAFALAIDVGNTLTRFGLFEGNELASTWCATTRPVITVDEAHAMLREFFHIRGFSSGPREISIERAIVSSVVPSITDAWVQAAHAVSASRPLVVGPGLKTGLKMRFDDPGEVGSDRIADMVAAKELFGFPLIVVDFGTTTNFEVLDEDGAFAGGIIAPGLRLSLSALSSAAARLSMVEMKAPASIVDTQHPRSYSVGRGHGRNRAHRRPHRYDLAGDGVCGRRRHVGGRCLGARRLVLP